MPRKQLPSTKAHNPSTTEYHRQATETSQATSTDCVAAKDGDVDTHGPTNPISFELQKETGYIPKRRQSTVQLASNQTSLQDCLQIISLERLNRMPHRASLWDRVVRSLEGFALQLSACVSDCSSSIPNASATASKAYACCKMLLRMGPNRILSLEPALFNLATTTRALALYVQQRHLFDTQMQSLFAGLFASAVEMLCGIPSCLQTHAFACGLSNPCPYGTSWHTLTQIADALSSKIAFATLSEDDISDRLPLVPSDGVIRHVYQCLAIQRARRTEFTLEWFSRPLYDFLQSSDSTFWISGPPGCGKSMLFGWISETLWTSNQSYTVLVYIVDPTLPSETTITALLKSLIWQSCQYQPSIMSRVISILSEITDPTQALAAIDINRLLFEAFELAIHEFTSPIVVLIDGISEIIDTSASPGNAFERFTAIASDNVRLIMLSRPFSRSASTRVRTYTITSSNISGDIYHVLASAMNAYSTAQRSIVANWATKDASANHISLQLILPDIDGHLARMASIPCSLSGLIGYLLTKVDMRNDSVRTVLTMSAVASRPFTQDELRLLLNTLPERRKQTIDLAKVIDRDCMSVVKRLGGIVSFRHPSIREHLLGLESPPAMHTEMVLRLLQYFKTSPSSRSEPTTSLSMRPSGPGPAVVKDALSSQPLLQYAFRYWTTHYNLCDAAQGSSSLRKAPMVAILQSVALASMEAAFWQGEPAQDRLKGLQSSLRVRQELVGDCQATLLAMANLATFLTDIGLLNDAADYFSAAFRLAQQLLPEYDTFTTDCVTSFLDIAEDTSVDNVVKTEMLQYMTDMSRLSGSASEVSLDYHRRLANHYVQAGQGQFASQALQSIYQTVALHHGANSTQAKSAASDLANHLQAVQEPLSSDQVDADLYENLLDNFDAKDRRRMRLTALQANKYASNDDLVEAELTYLGFWQDTDPELEEQEWLDAGLQYASFLLDTGRTREAQTVLTTIWSRLNGKANTATLPLFHRVASLSERAHMPSIAFSIRNVILNTMQANDYPHLEQQQAQEDFDRSLEQVCDDSSTQLLSQDVEITMRTSVETALSASPSTISATTIKVGQFVIASLKSQQRWSELMDLLTVWLRIAWPDVLEIPSDTPPAGDWTDLAPFATEVGQGYEKLSEPALAAHTYHRLVQLAHDWSHSDVVAASFKAAVTEYPKSGQKAKIVHVTRDLLSYYRRALPGDDPRILETWYKLASLQLEHGQFEQSAHSYQEIADLSAKFHDGLPALRALLAMYLNKEDWEQARRIYQRLWSIFIGHGPDADFPRAAVRELYSGYSKMVPDVRTLALEYRQGCASAFGEQDPITVEAAMEVARTVSSNTSDAAVQIYEWVVDLPANDGISSMQVKAASELLPYYQAHSDDVWDQQRMSRALKFQKSEFLQRKTDLGYNSMDILSSLALHVSFLIKDGTPQSRQSAIEILQQAFEALLHMATDSTSLTLFQRVASLVAIFQDVDRSAAEDLMDELYSRLLPKPSGVPQSSDVLIDQPTLRSELTFMTAFDICLTENVSDPADYYNTVLLESLLWQAFRSRLGGDATADAQGLIYGAKLWSQLTKRSSRFSDDLEKQLRDLFLKTCGATFSVESIACVQGDFFQTLLATISTARNSAAVARTTSTAMTQYVKRLIGESRFPDAIAAAQPSIDFLRYMESLSPEIHIEPSFDLALSLAKVEGESKTQARRLGTSLMHELMETCRAKDMSLENVDINLLNGVVDMLGEQENYEDMEWVLNRLWISRHNRESLDIDTIVQIGRRLVDVRLLHDHIDSAIDLAEDMLYNLRHVYGPTHDLTIDLAEALSKIYSDQGNQSAARAVAGMDPLKDMDDEDDPHQLDDDESETDEGVVINSVQPSTNTAFGNAKSRIEHLLSPSRQTGNYGKLSPPAVIDVNAMALDGYVAAGSASSTGKRGSLSVRGGQADSSWRFPN